MLATSNIDVVKKIKQALPLHNINSFAEFYMQIAEKYKSEYQKSLLLLRDERKYLAQELAKIDGLRVIPSQSNFIITKLTNNVKARMLTENLLSNYNILIKNLSKEINHKQYIWIAIRNREDNDKLLYAIKNELISLGTQ